MINHRIEYVPLTKDPNGSTLVYPIYVPIVVDNPNTLISTGSLDPADVAATKEILNITDEDLRASNEVASGNGRVAGFPLAAVLSAILPFAIPAAVKVGKNIINKFRNKNSTGRAYLGRGDDEDSDIETASFEDDNGSLNEDDEVYESGYIPTNPNISSLRKLQALYEKYNK